MRKGFKVMLVYLLLLVVCSLLFSWLGISSFMLKILNISVTVNLMLCVTIFFGLSALYFTVSKKSFLLFCALYTGSLILKYITGYLGARIGLVHIANSDFDFRNVIVYWENAFKSGTPLPFIICWFLNYAYITYLKKSESKSA